MMDFADCDSTVGDFKLEMIENPHFLANSEDFQWRIEKEVKTLKLGRSVMVYNTEEPEDIVFVTDIEPMTITIKPRSNTDDEKQQLHTCNGGFWKR